MTHNRPLALVTGASSGIGLELTKQFADNGFDLLVIAEDEGLVPAMTDLVESGGDPIDVEAVQADLATPLGIERVKDAVGDRVVEAAALNAGVGLGGAFVDTDLDAEIKMIELNVIGTVVLTKYLVRTMAARDDGRILITSSIASTMPGSYQSVYNATKSFLQSFTEALQEELKDSGVSLTALMPGPTDTNFFHRAGMDDTRVGQSSKDDPAQVAAQGFAALMAGKDRQVAGSLKTKAQELGNKVTPDSVKAKMHRVMAEPQDDE